MHSKEVQQLISAARELGCKDERAKVLYREYDVLAAQYTLPAIAIELVHARSSSRFRIVHGERTGYHQILVNERVFKLNDTRTVARAFRHILLHFACHSKRDTHTRAFNELAAKHNAIDDRKLRMPASSVQRLTYICPNGCQELRTQDSVALVCAHCGARMRALGQPAYKQYRREQRALAKEAMRKARGDA